MQRTDQLPLRGVGALPPHTAVPVSQPAPAAHRPLQIVLLHAYQKGFSAMEVATMFSFYEVRMTAVQSGGLAAAMPRAWLPQTARTAMHATDGRMAQCLAPARLPCTWAVCLPA